MSRVSAWIGVEFDQPSRFESLIAGIGGFVTMAAVVLIGQWTLGEDATVVVASIAASVVIIFVAPTGVFSQPIPLVGGHLVGAIVGVTCARFVGTGAISAALAVAITIAIMDQFSFIHPPGGGTAFVAVFGGASVTDLGYRYVLAPVGLNVVIVLVLGIAFNYWMPWRRYPASLIQGRPAVRTTATVISHDEVNDASSPPTHR